jgi:hypothetical protein
MACAFALSPAAPPPAAAPQADALKRQEAAYVARQREELAVAEAVEAERAADKKRRALEQRDAQLAQLETLKANLLQEIEENRLEGELVRSAAEEEAGLNKVRARAVAPARARARGAARGAARAALPRLPPSAQVLAPLEPEVFEAEAVAGAVGPRHAAPDVGKTI